MALDLPTYEGGEVMLVFCVADVVVGKDKDKEDALQRLQISTLESLPSQDASND